MALSKVKCFDQVSGKVANCQQEHDEASTLCEPCLMDNDRKSAAGWCETCDEVLCSICYAGHCKPKIMRDHVLMSLEKMRTHKQMQRAPTTCAQHDGKPLEYYCESHKQLGCNACFVGEHRTCIKVVCINEISSRDNEDFNLLCIKLNDFAARIYMSKERAITAGSTIRQQYDQAVCEIQATGTKMKEYIDRLVNAKIAEAQKIQKASLSTLHSISNINDEVEAKLKTNTESLEFFTKEGNPRLLFINRLSIELASHALESKIQEAEKLDIMGIKFVFNTQLSRIMCEVKEIGTLDCTDVSRVQSATQVKKEVHVLTLPISNINSLGWIHLSPRFNVSVNLDINLSHVILCYQGFPTARIGIYEGQTLLFECEHRYVKSSDEMEEVEVVRRDGRRGVVLQAGHTFSLTFEKICDNGLSTGRRLDKLTMTTGGVTFNFSAQKRVYTGPFAGMKFTLV